MDDELLTAIAGELSSHGENNPQAVLAVADVAVRILGRDRCGPGAASARDRHRADGRPLWSWFN